MTILLLRRHQESEKNSGSFGKSTLSKLEIFAVIALLFSIGSIIFVPVADRLIYNKNLQEWFDKNEECKCKFESTVVNNTMKNEATKEAKKEEKEARKEEKEARKEEKEAKKEVKNEAVNGEVINEIVYCKEKIISVGSPLGDRNYITGVNMTCYVEIPIKSSSNSIKYFIPSYRFVSDPDNVLAFPFGIWLFTSIILFIFLCPVVYFAVLEKLKEDQTATQAQALV